MQEHFAANDCGRASQRAYRHLASTTLHEASKTSLLALHLDSSRSGNNARQASAAAGTVGRSQW